MPAESDGRANDEVVWNLVLYIRSLSHSLVPATPGK